MTQPSPDFEERLTAVEQRLDVVAADATAARHLAAADDRDYADVAVTLDALRSVLDAHAVRTAASLARHDETLARHDEMFARLATGRQQIVELLNTVIAGRGEQQPPFSGAGPHVTASRRPQTVS